MTYEGYILKARRDVELVARALCDHDLRQCGGSDGARLNPDMPNWHHYRHNARLAIAAMREPTEATMERGLEAFRSASREEFLEAWRSTIDEMLTDDVKR